MTNYPQAYMCPLSLDIMTDPVVDNEGHTFERYWIMKALETKHECPIGRHYLDPSRLKQNYALKDAIEMWKTYKLTQTQANSFTISSAPSVPSVPLTNMDVDLSVTYKDCFGKLCINVIPPMKGERTPSDIMCVVDTSGSMDDEVSVVNNNGVKESNGFNQLDIVKHGVKTVIESLGQNDRLGIVQFNTYASVVIGLTPMTNENKQKALTALESLKPGGNTNIWDGLKKCS